MKALTLLANADGARIPLADESVDCVVCSPPFWNLRDYGVDGQLGMEASPGEFVANLVGVFREVRRVLKPSGCAWVNMGDSYTSGNRHGHGTRVGYKQQTNRGMCGENDPPRAPQPPGLKPKDLCLVPARLSIALQEDGWWVRSQIIWHKPNPMPESCTDRPTTSHEYILLLTKSATYYYDQDAVREPQTGGTHSRGRGDGGHKSRAGRAHNARSQPSWAESTRSVVVPGGRNRRSVWTISTQPFPGAHFATFPVALPDICIRAGSSEHGCCAKCGAPWERVVERDHADNGITWEQRKEAGEGARRGFARNRPVAAGGTMASVIATTTGWRATCQCNTDDVTPAVVLDCFVGSGSTLIAARRLGRQGIGLDLSFPYLRDQARQRLELDRLDDWEQGREAAGELTGLPLFDMRE